MLFPAARNAPAAIRADSISGASLFVSCPNCLGRSAFQLTLYKLLIRGPPKLLSARLPAESQKENPLHCREALVDAREEFREKCHEADSAFQEPEDLATYFKGKHYEKAAAAEPWRLSGNSWSLYKTPKSGI